MNGAVATLQKEYAARRARNPEFSVRAFARWLGISPAQLSQVLSEKRPLTLKMASKIAERLGFSPEERGRFLSESSPVLRVGTRAPEKFRELEEDKFRLIADWYHLAILSLTQLLGAHADPRWIARRLGIAVTDANEALGRLRKLGLLSNPPTFQQLGDPIRLMGKAPSAAIRKFHQQTLTLAMDRLESVEMSRREFQAMTLAVEPAKLDWFRMRLDRFLTEVNAELETPRATEVYTVAVQFFPLDAEGGTPDSRKKKEK